MIRLTKNAFASTVILVTILIITLFLTSNDLRNRRHKRQSNTETYLNQPIPTVLSIAKEIHIITFDSIRENKTNFNITSNDLLVLLHIQKTGGTTFERHLVNDLNIDNPCSCTSNRRRCSCSRLHDNKQQHTTSLDDTWLVSRFSTGWLCGLHPDWSQLSQCLKKLDHRLFFMTFLRHPIHRFISEFRHVQRGATWKASKSPCENQTTDNCYKDRQDWVNVTLQEFLNCPSNMAFNRQTRMLASHNHISCLDYRKEYFSAEKDEEMLASAMSNLESIAFFGICEEQRLSQVVFEQTFDIHFKENFKQSDDNKTEVLISELSKNVKDQILKLNLLDLKLYRYALNLFNKRCTQLRINCESLRSKLVEGNW